MNVINPELETTFAFTLLRGICVLDPKIDVLENVTYPTPPVIRTKPPFELSVEFALVCIPATWSDGMDAEEEIKPFGNDTLPSVAVDTPLVNLPRIRTSDPRLFHQKPTPLGVPKPVKSGV